MSASFAALGLAPALVRAAAERGLVAPTAIQQAAIPPALQGRDVIGSAPTGSGKTAAFGLALLQRLTHAANAASATPTPGHTRTSRQTRALVLVPTRDLATQVGDVIRALAQHLPAPPKLACVFGGVSINPQMMGLRGGADVVVATPGRLLDLVDHNALALGAVEVLVLDEADRLLDDGFVDELARIVAMLPRRRQNLLFSATFPPAVRSLAQELLHDPVHAAAPAESDAVPAVVQHAVQVDAARRTALLRHLIERGAWTRVLVFVATQYATEHVADKLRRSGLGAAAFHGKLSQGARTQALDDFKAGRLQVLVATDMAARGIDITQLPVVVNYDLPRSTVDYVHRIGRTGRAGAQGLAVSFVGAAAEAHFRLIEKRQGLRVARERIEGFEPLEQAAPAAAAGGIKGRRKSRKDKLREAAL